MIDRRMTGLSRRNFFLGAAVAAPSIVLAQGLTRVKITQPSESLSRNDCIHQGRLRDLEAQPARWDPRGGDGVVHVEGQVGVGKLKG